MVGDNLFLSVRFGKSNPGFGYQPGNDLNLPKVAHLRLSQRYQWVDS